MPETYIWSFCLEIERDCKEKEGWEVLHPFGICAVYGEAMKKYIMRRSMSWTGSSRTLTSVTRT